MHKSKKPILIIEDDASIRHYLVEVFTGDDFPVESAANGQQALSVLESMPVMPSLIFLDLMMPVMDGQTFLLELQRNEYYKRFSKIPVIVLSASRFEIYGDVEVYLTKPPHIDEISALAEKYASSTES